jgi:3-deoxy-manno-octulosonate cytidylyltransferase (CMP-KDO synthetase)
MSVLAVIPARYASTRFPGKPLVMVAGKTLLARVYERALAAGVGRVVVATDDARIFAHAQSLGATVWMTRPDHPSGTDRLLEVAQRMPGYSCYLNIQGDEPFVRPDQLQALVATISGRGSTAIGTLVTPIRSLNELQNPNAVKAVISPNGQALYFSRAVVPHVRDLSQERWLETGLHYRHLGLYAFSESALEVLRTLPPAPLEQAEGLEQLRWLSAGLPIYTAQTDSASPAIDTPEDLADTEALIARGELPA